MMRWLIIFMMAGLNLFTPASPVVYAMHDPVPTAEDHGPLAPVPLDILSLIPADADAILLIPQLHRTGSRATTLLRVAAGIQINPVLFLQGWLEMPAGLDTQRSMAIAHMRGHGMQPRDIWMMHLPIADRTAALKLLSPETIDDQMIRFLMRGQHVYAFEDRQYLVLCSDEPYLREHIAATGAGNSIASALSADVRQQMAIADLAVWLRPATGAEGWSAWEHTLMSDASLPASMLKQTESFFAVGLFRPDSFQLRATRTVRKADANDPLAALLGVASPARPGNQQGQAHQPLHHPDGSIGSLSLAWDTSHGWELAQSLFSTNPNVPVKIEQDLLQRVMLAIMTRSRHLQLWLERSDQPDISFSRAVLLVHAKQSAEDIRQEIRHRLEGMRMAIGGGNMPAESWLVEQEAIAKGEAGQPWVVDRLLLRQGGGRLFGLSPSEESDPETAGTAIIYVVRLDDTRLMLTTGESLATVLRWIESQQTTGQPAEQHDHAGHDHADEEQHNYAGAFLRVVWQSAMQAARSANQLSPEQQTALQQQPMDLTVTLNNDQQEIYEWTLPYVQFSYLKTYAQPAQPRR